MSDNNRTYAEYQVSWLRAAADYIESCGKQAVDEDEKARIEVMTDLRDIAKRLIVCPICNGRGTKVITNQDKDHPVRVVPCDCVKE